MKLAAHRLYHYRKVRNCVDNCLQTNPISLLQERVYLVVYARREYYNRQTVSI